MGGEGGCVPLPPAPSRHPPPPFPAAAEGSAAPLDAAAVFRQLLVDKGVTAFGTWKSELPKIVFDGRFKSLPTHAERRRAFDAFVKTRSLVDCSPLTWSFGRMSRGTLGRPLGRGGGTPPDPDPDVAFSSGDLEKYVRHA